MSSTIPQIAAVKTIALPAADDYLETGGATNGSAAITLASLAFKIANVAVLKAVSITDVADGVCVLVMDRSTAGAGGGGLFKYEAASAATVNLGTIFAPNAGAGRWVRQFTGPLWASWFDAKGDGATDDSAALLSAIDVAKASAAPSHQINFKAGLFLSSAVLPVTASVRFVGAGAGFVGYAPFTYGTELRYTGGATASAFVAFTHNHFNGAGAENIFINANSLAAMAVLVDSCQGMLFTGLYAQGGTTHTVNMTSTTGETCSWNTFINLNIDDTYTVGVSGLRLGGAAANACHCSFINTRIHHAGARHGILLAACDNIKMDMTYIWRAPGGTGYGVEVDPTEQGGFPGENVFDLLETGTGGWHQPGTTVSMPAVIYNYQTGNAQPLPVTNGTPLVLSGNDGGRVASGFSDTFLGPAVATPQIKTTVGNTSFAVMKRIENLNGGSKIWDYGVDGAGGLLFSDDGVEEVVFNRGGRHCDFTPPVRTSGDFETLVAGKTLKVKSAVNSKAGTFTLVAGTVVIANTSVTINSVVMATLRVANGARAHLDIVCTAGVGFTVTGAATDAGTYNFVILEVQP